MDNRAGQASSSLVRGVVHLKAKTETRDRMWGQRCIACEPSLVLAVACVGVANGRLRYSTKHGSGWNGACSSGIVKEAGR